MCVLGSVIEGGFGQTGTHDQLKFPGSSLLIGFCFGIGPALGRASPGPHGPGIAFDRTLIECAMLLFPDPAMGPDFGVISRRVRLGVHI